MNCGVNNKLRLSFRNCKSCVITAMIIFHLILHSAVRIYDFHMFIVINMKLILRIYSRNIFIKYILKQWIVFFARSDWLLNQCISCISIYTLSDLGDLSNLIGSLSRLIQQYSPPSEWIMCELSVFPTFFRERSFKSRQNSRADFF